MHCLKYLADLPLTSLRVCPVICAQSKIPYGSPIGDLDFVGYIWNTAAFYLGPYYPDFHALYMCPKRVSPILWEHEAIVYSFPNKDHLYLHFKKF